MQAKGQPLHTDEDFDNFPSDWKDIYLKNLVRRIPLQTQYPVDTFVLENLLKPKNISLGPPNGEKLLIRAETS